MSNLDYLEANQDCYELIEDHEGTTGPVEDQTLINKELLEIAPVDLTITNAMEIAEKEAAQIVQGKKQICNKILAARFIVNRYKKQYIDDI